MVKTEQIQIQTWDGRGGDKGQDTFCSNSTYCKWSELQKEVQLGKTGLKVAHIS